jgi:peptide/nickel transport system substrate-binding protein
MKLKAARAITFMTAVAVLLLIPVLAIACGGSGTPSGRVKYVVADATGDWGYPSPYAHYSRGPGYTRMSLVFDSLVWKDDAGFVPALAQSWEYIPDEAAYLFDLRQDVRWHDGMPLTAHDVAFTVEYMKEHPYQWVDLAVVESVEAIDDHTVKVGLAGAYAPFLNDVAATLPIMPRHIWESVNTPEEFTGPEAVIGSGPFKLVDYSKEHGTYLYEAYDDYYQGRPAVDELQFAKISTEMVLAALRQGTVNAGEIPAEVVDEAADDGFTVLKEPYSWNAKMLMNHTREPLDNKDFRQALAYAVDRESLVAITQRGYAMEGSPGLIPQDSVWFNPDVEMYECDPARAQQLLQGLGYELNGDGNLEKDGDELTLGLITQSQFKAVGQFVKDALEDIGVKLDFEVLEGTTVDARVLEWDFDLSIYGHGGLYEPSILNRMIAGSSFNSARYTSNAALNQLLQDQMREMDEETRQGMVCQIQEIYAEDLPALTLYYRDAYWAYDGGVDLYYTHGGLGAGVPVPLNKMSFLPGGNP